ncbi:hypothetical protein GOBAR_DD30319 [Gossypium barbadense]|nr:hypothetical protein GOBAR_DD30319 [Gossypium barbadense]
MSPGIVSHYWLKSHHALRQILNVSFHVRIPLIKTLKEACFLYGLGGTSIRSSIDSIMIMPFAGQYDSSSAIRTLARQNISVIKYGYGSSLMVPFAHHFIVW